MDKLLAFIVAAIIALTAYLMSNNYLGNKFNLQEFYDSAKVYFSSSKKNLAINPATARHRQACKIISSLQGGWYREKIFSINRSGGSFNDGERACVELRRQCQLEKISLRGLLGGAKN